MRITAFVHLILLPWIYSFGEASNCSLEVDMPCVVYHRTGSDCSAKSLSESFQFLYPEDNWNAVSPGDFNGSPFCRKGSSQDTVHGLQLNWKLPDHNGATNIKGFEVLIEGGTGYAECLIVDISKANITKQHRNLQFHQEILPMKLVSNFVATIHSLPKREDQNKEKIVFTALKCHGGDMTSAEWTWSSVKLHSLPGQQLRILFDQPPTLFHFQQFKIVLKNEDLTAFYLVEQVINATHALFTKVIPGRYIVTIEPYDPDWQHPEKCKCKDRRGNCDNCRKTVASGIEIKDILNPTAPATLGGRVATTPVLDDRQGSEVDRNILIFIQVISLLFISLFCVGLLVYKYMRRKASRQVKRRNLPDIEAHGTRKRLIAPKRRLDGALMVMFADDVSSVSSFLTYLKQETLYKIVTVSDATLTDSPEGDLFSDDLTSIVIVNSRKMYELACNVRTKHELNCFLCFSVTCQHDISGKSTTLQSVVCEVVQAAQDNSTQPSVIVVNLEKENEKKSVSKFLPGIKEFDFDRKDTGEFISFLRAQANGLAEDIPLTTTPASNRGANDMDTFVADSSRGARTSESSSSNSSSSNNSIMDSGISSTETVQKADIYPLPKHHASRFKCRPIPDAFFRAQVSEHGDEKCQDDISFIAPSELNCCTNCKMSMCASASTDFGKRSENLDTVSYHSQCFHNGLEMQVTSYREGKLRCQEYVHLCTKHQEEMISINERYETYLQQHGGQDVCSIGGLSV